MRWNLSLKKWASSVVSQYLQKIADGRNSPSHIEQKMTSPNPRISSAPT